MARLYKAEKSFGARVRAFLTNAPTSAEELFYQPLCTVHLKKVVESEEIKLSG